MIYNRYRLANGIRLIHRNTDFPVAHCGMFINAGSRDEEPDEQGLAHFIEHLIFKGTDKRKAFHILSHMENVGGEINAYTSKEETCIYGSFMYPHYERWFDILSDITFFSSFPEKEVIKEKDVVTDEINSYKDSPAEQVIDDFDELIFGEHPLGRNILGTPGHLEKFGKEKIKAFISRNYSTEEMVVCSVGKIDFRKLVFLAEKYLGGIQKSGRKKKRPGVSRYRPVTRQEKKSNHQAHCITGNRGYSFSHNRMTSLLLLNNILGGPGMTSRLNMAVREKHGFCYNIESMYQAFSDTGMVGIYFGTDTAHLEKTRSLIKKELALLRDKKLGVLQMKRAINQFCGQVNMAHESRLNEMLYTGKKVLHTDQEETLEQINRRIEAVTPEDVIHAANEVFDPSCMSTLAYLP